MRNQTSHSSTRILLCSVEEVPHPTQKKIALHFKVFRHILSNSGKQKEKLSTLRKATKDELLRPENSLFHLKIICAHRELF